MLGRGSLKRSARRSAWGLAAWLAWLAASPAGEVPNDSARPHLAVPFTATPPALTADAADPSWIPAAAIAGLTPSLSPDSPASVPATEVRVLWDARALYVRFLCRGGEPYLPVHGHDMPLFRGDAVEVFLDPAGDGRQWMEFQATATNDTFEKLFLCTGEPKTDASLRLTAETNRREVWEFPGWDLPGLRSAAAPWALDGETVGWIVDLAIPAAGLLKRTGKDRFEPMALRADFLRYDWQATPTPGAERNLVSLDWSPVLLGAPHRSPAAYGFLQLVPHP